jgi:predicted glycoside hydrolase/deacetylase ChbG (UPF0249 family)
VGEKDHLVKLVIVADDYGLCESVNNGIMEAYQHGIVTELSLMLGSPGTNHALKITREQDVKNIGIHMLLKNWRDTGHLLHKPDYIELFEELSVDEIATLIKTELEEFERVVGRKPTHITSQYSIIGHPKALPTITKYAVANNIPMRQPNSRFTGNAEVGVSAIATAQIRRAGVVTTGYLFAHILGDDYDAIKQAFKDDLATLNPGESAEMVLHPGYVSEELKQSSSLVQERERDTKLATDAEFRQWIEGRGIKIVGYGEIGS